MEKIKQTTADKAQQNIEKIEKLFPNVITETKDNAGNIKKTINFEKLKQELSKEIVDNEESYDFTWVGKNQAVIDANTPTTKTLRPCKQDSVNWDTTENVYIEGDNLEVLKLLQETYLNKIKMIYIDPPYNTGNDFIYKDNFSKDKEEYEQELGIEDEEGKKLFRNTDSNGKFHSDWCSMMYSRLKLARNLLTDDGVIFISIDENEFDNLKKICDEIFCNSNFIENFIWIKNSTKNLSKTTSTNHEYILCYSKNKTNIEECNFFRVEKPGLKKVKAILEQAYKENLKVYEIEERLNKFFKSNPSLKGISQYNHVQWISEQKHYQVYTLSDISAPKSTGQAETYDIMHPKTGKPVKIPSRGWAFKKEKMEEMIAKNLVEFYENENHVPRIKRFLDTVETEVVKSFIIDNTDGKKENIRLFGTCLFDNPKPTTLLDNFIKLTGQNDIILDFFSGSATTAHAVMQLNAEDGGNRKYIMVQLPEKCDEKSEAYKAGYKNICEIGKERIRRAGKKIVEETGKTDLDIGFRVFRVDESNMKDIYFSPDKYNQAMLEQMESNIKEDRNSEDLLFSCMLNWGLELSLPHKIEKIGNNEIHIVNENELVACFDKNISEEVVKKIAEKQPVRVVFRDNSFGKDSDRINVEEIFKLKSPNTKIKVL